MKNTSNSDLPLLGARPMAHAVALRIARGRCVGLDTDEICALADHALVEAWQRFDSSRGVAFTTYAYRWVAGAASRAIRSNRAWGRRAVALDESAMAGTSAAVIERAFEARRALRRVRYRDRGLVFNHAVLGTPFSAMVDRRSARALRRRYRGALRLAVCPMARRR